MKKIKFIIIFMMLVNIINANSYFKYDLKNPDKKTVLPKILNEVSGVSAFDSNNIACIQDEIGVIFIYNLEKNKIIKRHNFKTIGDFEGISFAGESIFVLRSNGGLTEWKDFTLTQNKLKTKNYKFSLLTFDNEGLGFDKNNNRLLIAGKSKPFKRKHRDKRYIYEFDLENKKLKSDPAYILNINSIRKFIKNNKIKTNGKIKRQNFFPSGIAIHPQTKDIYIISSASKLMLIINQNGEIEHVEALDKKLFLQAEGITFLEDGTMIITNEAAGKSPTLLVYKMK
jgi:uncharacterized protein YjiK